MFDRKSVFRRCLGGYLGGYLQLFWRYLCGIWGGGINIRGRYKDNSNWLMKLAKTFQLVCCFSMSLGLKGFHTNHIKTKHIKHKHINEQPIKKLLNK